MSGYTPGPWDYIPSTEHHGPYVTTEFGTTVSDCYAMSNPYSLSIRNGGESRPIHHLADMADANARLIAAAPELLEALKAVDAEWATAFPDGPDGDRSWFGLGQLSDDTVALWRQIRSVIAKAEGR